MNDKSSINISLVVLFIAVIGSMILLSSCKVMEGEVASWSGKGAGKDSLGTNNGTLVNVTFSQGRTGQAFHFNGSDASVRIPDGPDLNPTNGLSLEVWVLVEQYPSNDGVVVAGKDWPWAKRQYMIALNSVGNRWAFRPHVGVHTGLAFFDGATSVQTNVWYHVVMTYDNSTLRLFVNGKLDGSLLVGGYVVPTSNPLLIGGFGQPPWTLMGRVDRLSLYNRALSAAEIESHYHAGSTKQN